MSTPFDPGDPRLTAYALGEATEPERLAVEKLLAESAEARAEVEQTREFASILSAKYAQEHEEYLASRPAADLPSNIVAFPGNRHGWRRGLGPGLKAAALIAATASLVYLTVRRPGKEESATVASVPAHELAMATASSPEPTATPLLALNPPAGAAAPALDKIDLNTKKVLSLDQPAAAPPPAASASNAGLVTDTSLAATAEKQATVESAARARFLPGAPAPAVRRAAQVAPSNASSGADASGGASLRDEPFARSVVRIRSSEGVFSCGVIVSSDGLILSLAPPQSAAMKLPLTVRLADERELPAEIEHADAPVGWDWLRIDAATLPAIKLATDAPRKDTPALVPTVNSQSGSVTFLRLSPATTESALAFNAAGELLLLELASTPKSFSRAKGTANQSASMNLRARPFSPTECEMLHRAIERRHSN